VYGCFAHRQKRGYFRKGGGKERPRKTEGFKPYALMRFPDLEGFFVLKGN